MSHHIDGFVLSIPRHCLNQYRRIVENVAVIWKDHGALGYREYIGDDLTLAGTLSFTDLVAATGADIILFGWVVFESRAARDLANERGASDPRMAELVGASNAGIDAEKMVYGCFRPLV